MKMVDHTRSGRKHASRRSSFWMEVTGIGYHHSPGGCRDHAEAVKAPSESRDRR